MSTLGAIFDFDGTLFDSMFIWETIGEEYLRSIGYEPKENLKETFKTMSLYKAVCYYKSEYGVTLSTDEIMNGVNNMLRHYYKDTIEPKPGVADFLEKLKLNGVQMCIATATDIDLVESALERCGCNKYFTGILTCNIVGSGKDEPTIYRNAQKLLKTEKSRTIVFEDALYAIKTAKQDDFVTVGVYDKYEKETAEVEKISDFYIYDFLKFDSFWKFASGL